MPTETERLRAIQEELNTLLEQKISDLLARAKTVRELTSQLEATEIELRKSESLKSRIESEISAQAGRGAPNPDTARRAESVQSTVTKLAKTRTDLIAQLAGVAEELKGATGGLV